MNTARGVTSTSLGTGLWRGGRATGRSALTETLPNDFGGRRKRMEKPTKGIYILTGKTN